MGDVTPFPAPRRHAFPPRVSAIVATADQASLPETGGRRGEYALADVARPLGLLHLSVKVIIRHLRVLARHDDMPLPKTPRIVQDRPVHGPRQICKFSRWDAGAIDAWLDRRAPTPPSAPIAPALREEMARRAVAIGAGR